MISLRKCKVQKQQMAKGSRGAPHFLCTRQKRPKMLRFSNLSLLYVSRIGGVLAPRRSRFKDINEQRVVCGALIVVLAVFRP